MKVKSFVVFLVLILLLPCIASAEDMLVTLTFERENNEYYLTETQNVTLQGPYSGSRWMERMSSSWERKTLEKRVNNVKKGIYQIRGCISANWDSTGRGAATKVRYTVEVVFTGNNENIIRTGEITSHTTCNPSTIVSFSVK